jgi:MFS family permease
VGEAGRAEVRLVGAAFALAALSALVIAPAPSYDPWAWLLWGREIVHGTLSTAEGPAFKPLPVAVTALLAPLGEAAPVAWVIVARTGAVLAVLLAFRLGRGLVGLLVTFHSKDRPPAPPGEDADPQESLWDFKWSRTTPGGDQRPPGGVRTCGRGH